MARKTAVIRTGLTLALGALALHLALLLPNHPDVLQPSVFARMPLELPALLLAALALRHRPWLAVLAAVVLTASVSLRLADMAMFTAYNRTFNPILDAFLIGAGFELLSDSIGTPLAVVTLAGAAVAIVLCCTILALSLGAWARVQLRPAGRALCAVGAMGAAGLVVADLGHHLKYWSFAQSPPGTAWSTRHAVQRVVDVQATAADLARFQQAAAEDPYADGRGLFNRIGDRDVLIIFIESYGRASFDNPIYAVSHEPILRHAEAPLRQAGFEMRSGWLTSPTSGGQSWLAHGTLSTGLWASDKARYAAMLASDRRSLFHLASEAGFRTSAFMPAIVSPWPEAELMGFEQIFPAARIPYAGAPFNWVTMPDQFTLSAYADLLAPDPRREFIQIALISSHAPWVPIPPVLPWDSLGDGSVFTPWAQSGPTPKEVWSDRDQVRTQYRKAISYSLRVTFDHIARLGPDAPLVLVVGDHQAAGFVAQSDNKDVPIHLIAPPGLTDHVSAWGWAEGLIPQADTPVWPMDAFRNRFVDAFTKPTPLAAPS